MSTAMVILATIGGEWSPQAEETVSDESAASDGSTIPEAPTLVETLAEYARGLPNYGYAPGSSARVYAIYYQPFDTDLGADLEAGVREYRALLESFSPGVRGSFEGAAAKRMAFWEEEQDRREAERKRDEAERKRNEAEYAVFIEEHLRRLYGGNEKAHD